MPEQNKHFLTDRERDLLQKVLDEHRGRSTNISSGRENDQDDPAPEVYIAKPQTDIPARDDTVSPPLASSEDCNIYRITINSSGDPEIVLVTGLSKKVYNYTTEDISSETFIVITRTKSGKWVPLVGGGGGDTFNDCGCDRCYTQSEMTIDVGGGWFAAPQYSIVDSLLPWDAGTVWKQTVPFGIECAPGVGTGTADLEVYWQLTVSGLGIGEVTVELKDFADDSVLATWKNALAFWIPHCGQYMYLESQTMECALFAADCVLCLKVDAEAL